MTDTARVNTNVDTFNEGGSYFVRTEIEARSVTINGPFPDLETAHKLQTAQIAHMRQASDMLREVLQRATTTSPAANGTS